MSAEDDTAQLAEALRSALVAPHSPRLSLAETAVAVAAREMLVDSLAAVAAEVPAGQLLR